jgi:hypothetical protein
MFPPIYWRRHVISTHTTGFEEGETLQKIPDVLPIRQDSKRKRK